MNALFTYSVLKYVHSEVLGECINIGVLVLDHNQQKLSFVYPKSFKRLTGVYHEFFDWQVKSYLRAFRDKCFKINRSVGLVDYYSLNLDRIISNEFIIHESTALQFSTYKSIELKNFNLEEVSEWAFKLYLSSYLDKGERLKHDEEFIHRTLKNKLRSIKPDIDRYLNDDSVLVIDSLNIKYKIDFSWQNKVEHLVKPISFDLVDSQKISEKAFFNQALINKLVDEKEEFSTKQFDIIISKPSHGDRKAISNYRKAIDILNNIEANKQIFEESKIDLYCQDTIDQIESHSADNRD